MVISARWATAALDVSEGNTYLLFSFEDNLSHASSLWAPNTCARFCDQDVLILGSVGSHNWKGAIHELRGPKTTQIHDPQMQVDSYLGTELNTSNISCCFCDSGVDAGFQK